MLMIINYDNCMKWEWDIVIYPTKYDIYSFDNRNGMDCTAETNSFKFNFTQFVGNEILFFFLFSFLLLLFPSLFFPVRFHIQGVVRTIGKEYFTEKQTLHK